MPIYIGNYLADTTRLTTEQHGAYFLLMMDYWRSGPPPDDDEILQNVTRLSAFLWKKTRPVLEKLFYVHDGAWHHKIIDEEIAAALEGKGAASEKARKAAEARWGKKDAPSIAQVDAPEVLEECPLPLPLPLTPKTLATGGKSTHSGIPRAQPAELSAAMRRYSIAAQPADPRIIAAADAGVSVATVEAACAEAKAAKPGQRIAPAYVLRIAERWTTEAAAPQARASPSKPLNVHDDRRRAYEILTGNTPHEPASDIIDI